MRMAKENATTKIINNLMLYRSHQLRDECSLLRDDDDALMSIYLSIYLYSSNKKTI